MYFSSVTIALKRKLEEITLDKLAHCENAIPASRSYLKHLIIIARCKNGKGNNISLKRRTNSNAVRIWGDIIDFRRRF